VKPVGKPAIEQDRLSKKRGAWAYMAKKIRWKSKLSNISAAGHKELSRSFLIFDAASVLIPPDFSSANESGANNLNYIYVLL